MKPKKNTAWRIREICNWLIDTEEDDWRTSVMEGSDYPDEHIFAHALIIKCGLPHFNEHYLKPLTREIELINKRCEGAKND